MAAIALAPNDADARNGRKQPAEPAVAMPLRQSRLDLTDLGLRVAQFGSRTPAGGSGFVVSKGSRAGVIGAKLKRMPFIAANGLLILIPSALFLAPKARAGDFDATFYAVQALEVLAGATNIMLFGLNMLDGLRLRGRLRRAPA